MSAAELSIHLNAAYVPQKFHSIAIAILDDLMSPQAWMARDLRPRDADLEWLRETNPETGDREARVERVSLRELWAVAS